MRAAGESPSYAAGFVAVWALSWAPLVLCYLLVAIVGTRGRLARLDARRIARSALLALAAVGFGSWVAGFSMGMGVADAFAVSGGDAAWTGPALTAAATVCGVAAALRILPPPRLPAPAPAP